ncbi:MAG: aminoglycoside phosphotransferase family protein [Anaerolineae bacterium]|nr:aminoglycoside phosphotransferase family protein [Anaerolineae bacterium]
MSKESLHIAAIQRVYPNLEIQSAQHRTGGQNNDILIVNSALIFRFPRYAEAFQALTDETAILKLLQAKLPLPTPNPIYAHLDALDFNQAFVGYPMIAGESVDIYQLESRFDSHTCQHLADQLADFLKALHGISPAQLPIKPALHDDRAYWTDLYQRIHAKLFPLMRAAGREQVINHFEPYLALAQHFDYTPVLRHGDFGTGNILFDATAQQFTGVIDFGSAALGDPATDLAAIYGWRGRGATFARRLFKRYPELEAMLSRAQFYAGTFLLQEALFGLENNEPELIASGLEPYI